MNDTQLETLDQVRQFLEGTETVSFQIESKNARYRWLQQTLVRFRYLQLSKTDKGLIASTAHDFQGLVLSPVSPIVRDQDPTRPRLDVHFR